MLRRFNIQLILVLGAVIISTVIICISAISCSGGKITFETSFYFVCYRKSDNAVSAGSLSDTASSLGGAGYILYNKDSYYVTLSCYYTKDEADAVCSNLKKRDLDCTVLNIETNEYRLENQNAKNNQNLYIGNLNTLNSLSTLAYECANGLDTGEYSQSNAKQVLASIIDTLNGLKKNNENNCFTEIITSAIEECESVRGGYLYSKNMRYIQIALADRIINARLY